LQLVEMLNHISNRSEGIYIPVAPYILRMLASPSLNLTAMPKRERSEGDDELRFMLRAKKSQSRSGSYAAGVAKECLYLLTEHLASQSFSIGFPEAYWAVQATLNKMRREVKVPILHAQMTTIVRHMESTSQAIRRHRDAVNFGPCDLSAVKQFEDQRRAEGCPLTQYYQSQRQQRIQQFTERQKKLLGDDNQQRRNTLDGATKVAIQKQRKQGGAKKRQRTETS